MLSGHENHHPRLPPCSQVSLCSSRQHPLGIAGEEPPSQSLLDHLGEKDRQEAVDDLNLLEQLHLSTAPGVSVGAGFPRDIGLVPWGSVQAPQ